MVGKYNIVKDIQENFNIAAINKLNNMSLFGKKEKPLNIVNLTNDNGEVQAIFRGELGVDSEVNMVGGNDILNGEYTTIDNKVTIENNKVVGFEDKEKEEEKKEDVKAIVNEAVAPLLEMIQKQQRSLKQSLIKSLLIQLLKQLLTIRQR